MNCFLKFFFHLLVLIISGLWILLYCPGFFEINKTPETLTTSQQCPEILTGIESPEDMVRYNGVLLVSSRNIFALQQGTNDIIKNGAIYGYYARIESKMELEKLRMIDFPKEKTFYPFGMKLYNNNLLYVINQSFREKEGELIEVFKIIGKNEIQLKYIRTIRLPDYLVGKINNLAVLSENEIFVSQFQASNYALLNIIVQLFNIKVCGVYYCKIENDESQCFKQQDINSITAFNNGLLIQVLSNQMKRLLVSLTLEKTIGVFNIHKGGDPYKKITYQNGISIEGYPDNIFYDEEQDSYYIGAMLQPLEMKNILTGIDKLQKYNYLIYLLRNNQLKDSVKAWGSVSIIKNRFYVTELKAETIVQLNDLIRTISVAVRIDDKLYLGSAFDNKILVCNIKELFDKE